MNSHRDEVEVITRICRFAIIRVIIRHSFSENYPQKTIKSWKMTPQQNGRPPPPLTRNNLPPPYKNQNEEFYGENVSPRASHMRLTEVWLNFLKC